MKGKIHNYDYNYVHLLTDKYPHLFTIMNTQCVHLVPCKGVEGKQASVYSEGNGQAQTALPHSA